MNNDLASVTLVTDISVNADAMTKNIFYLGLDKGAKYVKNIKGLDAIFVTKDKKVYVTEGLKNNFKITDSGFKLIHNIK